MLLDKHALVITKTITKRPNAPWYNNDIHEAKQKRRRCERKGRTTRTDDKINKLRDDISHDNITAQHMPLNFENPGIHLRPDSHLSSNL